MLKEGDRAPAVSGTSSCATSGQSRFPASASTTTAALSALSDFTRVRLERYLVGV